MRWPLYEEGGPCALDLLQEIVLAARRDGTSYFDSVAALALRCAGNAHALVHDHDHLDQVRQARDNALEGRWALAERFMKHGGS